MNIKILFVFAFSFAFISSSHAQNNIIEGNLQFNQPVRMIYLNYSGDGRNLKDSSTLINGKFRLSTEISRPTWALLSVVFEKTETEKNAKMERLQLFMEPGKMNIKAKDSLKFAKVSGSKSQKVLEDYLILKLPFDEKSRDLNTQFQNYKKGKDEVGMKKIKEQLDELALEKEDKLLREYLKNNPKTPIAFYVLDQYFAFSMDVTKAEPIFESLDPKIQLSESGVAFKKRMEAIKNTNIGSMAMNFTQNDTLEKPVSLSDFRGKYVLLDFWASWCVPCRAENPNVVKAFNEYKDKNFTVLSVSLDQPGKKQSWLDAIHKDNLTWTHVSDLQFWNNAVAKQYSITAVPQNLLIDPSGKIVAKNIKGEELSKKLSEIFKD